MSNKNKKTPSLIGNIISIYVLFFLVSRITNIQNFTLSKVAIPILAILITGLAFYIIKKRLNENKSESDGFTVREEIPKVILESNSNEANYLARNKIMRKKTDITEQFSNIDKNNHYVVQYKALYESGVMTKEELNDRISKLSKNKYN